MSHLASQQFESMSISSKRSLELSEDELQSVIKDAKRQRREQFVARKQNLTKWLTEVLGRAGISQEQFETFRRVAHLSGLKTMIKADIRRDDAYNLDMEILTGSVVSRLNDYMKLTLIESVRPSWLVLFTRTMPLAYTRLAMQSTQHNMQTIDAIIANNLPFSPDVCDYIAQLSTGDEQQAFGLVREITLKKSNEQLCTDLFKMMVSVSRRFTPPEAVPKLKPTLQELALKVQKRAQSALLRELRGPVQIWLGDSLIQNNSSRDFASTLVRVSLSKRIGVNVRVYGLNGGYARYSDVANALNSNKLIANYSKALGKDLGGHFFRGLTSPNDLSIYTTPQYDDCITRNSFQLQLEPQTRLSELMVLVKVDTHEFLYTTKGRSPHVISKNLAGWQQYRLMAVSDLVKELKKEWQSRPCIDGVVVRCGSEWRPKFNLFHENKQRCFDDLVNALNSKSIASMMAPDRMLHGDNLRITLHSRYNMEGACKKCRDECKNGNIKAVVESSDREHLIFKKKAGMFFCVSD